MSKEMSKEPTKRSIHMSKEIAKRSIHVLKDIFTHVMRALFGKET